MHRLSAGLALAVVTAVPLAARAGWVVEGSVGKGVRLNPDVKADQSNVMIAPGYTLLDAMIRIELGVVANIPDIKNSSFDFGLRPMVVVVPPILPIYGRAIFAVTNLINEPRTIAFGGAVGVKVAVAGLGLFAEAGLLPRSEQAQFRWHLEGRLGAFVTF
jgi:hypothetical protein